MSQPTRAAPRVAPEVLLRAGDLRAFAEQVFAGAGLRVADAWQVADALVEADLRGIHTHGTIYIPRYARGFLNGGVNPTPTVREVRARGAVACLDGDNGLGHVVAAAAMERAIALAREHAVGLVGVNNSNHFGAAARYAEMALSHGMIGFVTTNGPAALPPWGGRAPVVSNNPLAWAIPAGQQRPIVLDMACSVVARGKIRLAAQEGRAIPRGWALDAQGSPTEDPTLALDGVLLPTGEYKGSGLAIVNECLAGALTGALMTLEVSRRVVYGGVDPVQDAWGIGHLLMAIDVEAFMPLAELTARVDRLVEQIRTTERARGFERIYLPGEIELELRERRLRDGVPLAASTVERLRAFGAERGVPFPQPLHDPGRAA